MNMVAAWNQKVEPLKRKQIQMNCKIIRTNTFVILEIQVLNVQFSEFKTKLILFTKFLVIFSLLLNSKFPTFKDVL